MQLARMIGTATSTVKNEKLAGVKLVTVQPVRPSGEEVGAPFLAEDAVGAGVGQLVMVVTGGPARDSSRVQGAPVDAVVVALIDAVSG